jgi:hypothetical protein
LRRKNKQCVDKEGFKKMQTTPAQCSDRELQRVLTTQKSHSDGLKLWGYTTGLVFILLIPPTLYRQQYRLATLFCVISAVAVIALVCNPYSRTYKKARVEAEHRIKRSNAAFLL